MSFTGRAGHWAHAVLATRNSKAARRFLTERPQVITYDFGISETTEQRAILFADVCESTRIYETLGDTRALELINRLFAALEREVAAAGGVTVKTLGDGMVCQFRESDDGYRAACKMQEAVVNLAPSNEPNLKISIGYTYGPVVLKDADVFGDTVNVCARLVSLANAAQVLTTRQTVDALSPILRERCRELYATKVRGRAGEVMVCEVMWRLDPETTRINDVERDAMPQAAWIWILKLTHSGESFIVDEATPVRLGREAGNDVVVQTDHASLVHARIFSRDGHFYIVDQSTNGTFLLVDGTAREVRLRRSESMLGERGWIGLGKSAAHHGDHVLRYRLERRS
ncbi:MAG: adenylate/guanylate cyclase domain-containing protein [Betaproteobacteria bacterium]|nr:MAG: adenylate/guanylate cyclase domain-containing protein [Betaproteobacteria bacterium]